MSYIKLLSYCYTPENRIMTVTKLSELKRMIQWFSCYLYTCWVYRLAWSKPLLLLHIILWQMYVEEEKVRTKWLPCENMKISVLSDVPYWYTSKNISRAHYLLCNIKILWDACHIFHTTLLDIYPFLLIQRVQMLRAKYLWKKKEKRMYCN